MSSFSKALTAFLLLVASFTGATAFTHGNAGPTHTSSLGVNVGGGQGNAVAGMQTELPFLNILKSNGGWGIGNGNGCTGIVGNGWTNIQMDVNGWPTTMVLSGTSGCSATDFTLITNFGAGTLFDGTPTMPTGHYVLLYSGVGTATVDTNCSFVEGGGTGRNIYNCVNATGFVELHITAINVGNPIKNFQLVYSPDSTGVSGGNHIGVNEALLNSGEAWSPTFKAKIQPFKALRSMDYFSILSNPIANWADRTPLGYYSWTLDPGQFITPNSATQIGVPFEAFVALCNETNSDCWINIPVEFTQAANTSLAQYTKANLNTNLRAIVEYGNEFFNFAGGAGGSWIRNYLTTQSGITGSGSIINQGIVGSVLANDAWLSVYGADAPARLVRALGGQSTFQFLNQFIMAYTLPGQFSGTAASHATHFTAAPYWDFVGSGYPIAWSADADPYDKFMKQAGGSPLIIPPTTAPNCATSGTSVAYTVSSNTSNCSVNGSMPSVPANGTFVVINFNQPSTLGQFTASSSGSVLNVTAISAGALAVGVAVGRASTGAAEAIIASFGSGAGGIGTYNLDRTFNVTSQAFVAGSGSLSVDGGPAYTMTLGDGQIWDLGSGVFSTWPTSQIPILSGTYNSGTGAVSLTMGAPTGLAPGNNFIVSGATGTGSFASINGTALVATAGTTGTTVNFTIGTGLTMTITGGTVTFGQQIFCFTNATIAGVVTPTWRQAFGDASNLGSMPWVIPYYGQNYSDALNAGLGLLGYESGQNFVAGNNTLRQSWFFGAMRQARMGTLYTNYFAQLKSVSHDALTMHYNFIGTFGAFGTWQALEGVLQSGSPRYDALKNFNFLLRRDIDPANDNTPMFLNKAA